MRSRNQSFLFCALFAAIFLVGCQKKNQQSRIKVFRGVAFSYTSLALLKKLKLKPKPLQSQLLSHLDQAKSFLWFRDEQKSPPNGYKLSVDLGMLPLPPDRKRRLVRLQWFLSYRLTPIQSGREVLFVKESKNMSYPLQEKLPKREVVAQIFKGLWKSGARSLALYGRMYLESSKTLMKRLKEKESFAKYHATELLAHRKHKAAVPLLLKQLKTKNKRLLLGTIGALVKMKDRRAAAPLIELARLREGAFLAQIISALGEIGGEEAKGFLFTLASSHNVPLIQQNAKEALQEIRARERKAAAQKKKPATR